MNKTELSIVGGEILINNYTNLLLYLCCITPFPAVAVYQTLAKAEKKRYRAMNWKIK